MKTLDLQAKAVALQLSQRPLVHPQKPCTAERFYILSFAEAEVMVPSLGECQIFSYAWRMHEAFLSIREQSMICMARSLQEADVVLLPSHATRRPNEWDRRKVAAVACTKSAYLTGLKSLKKHPNLHDKFLLHLKAGSDVWSPEKSPGPGFPFLEFGATWSSTKLAEDVVLPGEPSALASDPKSREAFLEPAASKRYLLSFKGPLRHLPFSLHDDERSVFVNEEDDRNFADPELLWNSAFSLIFESNAAAFSDIVCSGSIPVSITDWSPPFKNMVKFKTYGLRLRRVRNLEELLLYLQDAREDMALVMILRQNAQAFCNRALQSYEVQAAAALRAVMKGDAHRQKMSFRETNLTLLFKFRQTFYHTGELWALSWNGRVSLSKLILESHGTTRAWSVMNLGPFISAFPDTEGVYTVTDTFKILWHDFKPHGGLRSLFRATGQGKLVSSNVTSIALCRGFIFGLGHKGQVLRQKVSEMTTRSRWKMLLSQSPPGLNRLGASEKDVFGASKLRVYRLEWNDKTMVAQWRNSTRSHLPGDVRHILE